MRQTERLRRLVDDACETLDMTKLDIARALGKTDRWTSSALNNAKGVSVCEAVALCDFISTQKDATDRQRFDATKIAGAVKLRHTIESGANVREIPILIDERDVDAVAGEIVRYFETRELSVKNLKRFFLAKIPPNTVETGTPEIDESLVTNRDLFAHHYRMMALRRAWGSPNGKVPLRVEADGRRECSIAREDVPRVLWVVESMIRDSPSKKAAVRNGYAADLAALKLEQSRRTRRA